MPLGSRCNVHQPGEMFGARVSLISYTCKKQAADGDYLSRDSARLAALRKHIDVAVCFVSLRNADRKLLLLTTSKMCLLSRSSFFRVCVFFAARAGDRSSLSNI